jgi:hypothetical protein
VYTFRATGEFPAPLARATFDTANTIVVPAVEQSFTFLP